MDIAGVVLGTIPLILYAIDKHKQRKTSHDVKRIRRRIFLEQRLLEATFISIGLQLGKTTRKELETHLKKAHPTHSAQFLDIIDRMEEILQQIMNELMIDSNGQPISQSDGSEWSQMKRFVKRHVGNGSRKALIEELREWNEDLNNLIGKPEMPSPDYNPLVTSRRAHFDSAHCDKSRTNAALVHEAIMTTWQCCCEEHHGALKLQWHKGTSTKSDEFVVAISVPERNKDWFESIVEVGTSLDCPPLSNIKSAWVSDCPPDSTTQTAGAKRAVSRGVRFSSDPTTCKTVRAQEVHAAPLPQISCLCVFTGALQKRDSGIIPGTTMRNSFSLDTAPLGQTIRSISIASALRHVESSRHPCSLSKKHRLSVAAASCWALLYLCGTPWISSSEWSGSHSLQLLVRTHGSSIVLADQMPMVFHSFEKLQRAGKSVWPSHNTDELLGQTISDLHGRNKALFALGILLIELYVDTSFDELRELFELAQRSKRGSSVARSHRLSDLEIAEHWLYNKIYEDAGQSYGYAIQRCIRCEFPGRPDRRTFDFSDFRTEFYKGVVAPIQAFHDIFDGNIDEVLRRN
ncbi:hypothetical protein Micbo1qcDRAFT_166189 [Microdochium bolleyi]|uniref:DUF7580 domain-containing protein n=1 Tax=Microdochium bolleyi TaxID=196109 RepID=A0A136IVB5_9PEZI|nr:hypothetical protein Micbo1qcDRAFT_166189 [Microdochium bolleyi]